MRRTDSRQIGGRVIQLPMVDVHTVGAGRLHRLAGPAAPFAPARDPRGGSGPPAMAAATEPTVTDANLLLGYLDAGSTLAGGVELDVEAARDAVGRLAAALGLDSGRRPRGSSGSRTRRWCERSAWSPWSAAWTAPLRADAVRGAGPMHAAALAEELGMDRILCPAPAALSALGLISSERRRDRARTVLLSGAELTASGSPPRSTRLHRAIGAGLEDAAPKVTYGSAIAARPSSSTSRVAAPIRPSWPSASQRSASAATATVTPRRRSSWSTSAGPGRPRPAPQPEAAPTSASSAGASGALRRGVDRGRGAGGEPEADATAEGLACSSCRRPPWSCRRAGVARWMRDDPRARDDGAARSGHAPGPRSAPCAPPARRSARCSCAPPLGEHRGGATARRRSSTPPRELVIQAEQIQLTSARCPTRSRPCSGRSTTPATSGS